MCVLLKTDMLGMWNYEFIVEQIDDKNVYIVKIDTGKCEIVILL
jgi:hypothetical protein